MPASGIRGRDGIPEGVEPPDGDEVLFLELLAEGPEVIGVFRLRARLRHKVEVGSVEDVALLVLEVEEHRVDLGAGELVEQLVKHGGIPDLRVRQVERAHVGGDGRLRFGLRLGRFGGRGRGLGLALRVV